MEKIKKIAELLDGKGTILVRNASTSSEYGNYNKENWYIHCWIDNGPEIFTQYVPDLDVALDKIINILEGKND